MTTQPENKKSTGAKPWLRVLFVASLALNLVVLGAVGSAMLMRDKWHARHPSRLDMVGGPLTRALNDKDRRAIGQQMRQAYRDGHPTRQQQREEFQLLIADLKAEPFVPDAVRARMSNQRVAFKDRLELGQTILLERLAQMSPAERKAYADRLQESVRGHWSRHKDWKE
ncbi:hypothetical protein PEL8287_01166 [Roseovarius litorisediminis]|uniref:Periplasmic heavy metal sensor n=1 Tax=Roseovarius litorisediminis TaxID=1312363 RepID=A0A1Y5RUC4_9RHOB|nr:periplasmic heavy metal sensor [Roseovarius litorisediminis]SLN25561.1 hypothetical protein PEL8287_01166 [Roseovarius litorisediminis]